jgi:hypothetical protein
MVRVCDEETVGCLEYNGHAFDNTPIETAGVGVDILHDKTTEQQCLASDSDFEPTGKQLIRGVRFQAGHTSDGATSHSGGGPAYRAFHGRLCFEIHAWFTQYDVGPGDYEEEGLKHEDPAAMKRIMANMDKVVHTFRFLNPGSLPR